MLFVLMGRYILVKIKLIDKGHSFISNGDTEVLISAEGMKFLC